MSDKKADIKLYLEKSKVSLGQMLPKHLPADRMVKIAWMSVERNPALLACRPVSLLRAVFQAAELGLEPGLMGEVYLVPFKDEVQAIVGYQGLLSLARRSGDVVNVEARVVYERDEFHVEYGLEPKLVHRPYMGDEESPFARVYAVATLKGGGKQFDVMSKAQIERIRARSRAANSGPWVTDYDEMAKKTVLRRLCKLLPRTPELARAIAHDDAVSDGEPSPVGIDVSFIPDDGTPAPKANGSRTEDLKSKLQNAAVETETQ